ncbi:hypothetical protein [Bifidobacterium pseudocatenulatum]|uniref:hypothetical protein n=1 Tax=Bifidobacterium pseudocatenulatum TaxID=28026 RepID=UPI003DA4B7C3
MWLSVPLDLAADGWFLMGPAVFLLPPSAPCDTPEKGGYSSFFKKRDCKDLLSGCAEKQAICGVVFFVARFWFCVVPFVAV